MNKYSNAQPRHPGSQYDEYQDEELPAGNTHPVSQPQPMPNDSGSAHGSRDKTQDLSCSPSQQRVPTGICPPGCKWDGTYDKCVPKKSAGVMDSESFRNWFGDSKVVDGEGNPLVVYHGTRNPGFSEFKSNEHSNYEGDIVGWFSEISELTTHYNKFRYVDDAGRYQDARPATYPVYLSVQNPLNLMAAGLDTDDVVSPGYFEEKSSIALSDEVRGYESSSVISLIRDSVSEIKVAGYDGVLVSELGTPTWAVFDASQIKSATGNSGEFDPESADITASIVSHRDQADDRMSMDDVLRGLNSSLIDASTLPPACAAFNAVSQRKIK